MITIYHIPKGPDSYKGFGKVSLFIYNYWVICSAKGINCIHSIDDTLNKNTNSRAYSFVGV